MVLPDRGKVRKSVVRCAVQTGSPCAHPGTFAGSWFGLWVLSGPDWCPLEWIWKKPFCCFRITTRTLINWTLFIVRGGNWKWNGFSSIGFFILSVFVREIAGLDEIFNGINGFWWDDSGPFTVYGLPLLRPLPILSGSNVAKNTVWKSIIWSIYLIFAGCQTEYIRLTTVYQNVRWRVYVLFFLVQDY